MLTRFDKESVFYYNTEEVDLASLKAKLGWFGIFIKGETFFADIKFGGNIFNLKMVLTNFGPIPLMVLDNIKDIDRTFGGLNFTSANYFTAEVSGAHYELILALNSNGDLISVITEVL
ncbi:MAG: hypothetical protein BWX91_02597 [Spirochaetes bacterium ADurb.Bin133]|nr:MAG: hypothetical protein BWX91_02597 [Spirochaetes bacterium ADurb.Bin133]